MAMMTRHRTTSCSRCIHHGGTKLTSATSGIMLRTCSHLFYAELHDPQI